VGVGEDGCKDVCWIDEVGVVCTWCLEVQYLKQEYGDRVFHRGVEVWWRWYAADEGRAEGRVLGGLSCKGRGGGYGCRSNLRLAWHWGRWEGNVGSPLSHGWPHEGMG
jgi:hypothetical protein